MHARWVTWLHSRAAWQSCICVHTQIIATSVTISPETHRATRDMSVLHAMGEILKLRTYREAQGRRVPHGQHGLLATHFDMRELSIAMGMATCVCGGSQPSCVHSCTQQVHRIDGCRSPSIILQMDGGLWIIHSSGKPVSSAVASWVGAWAERGPSTAVQGTFKVIIIQSGTTGRGRSEAVSNYACLGSQRLAVEARCGRSGAVKARKSLRPCMMA